MWCQASEIATTKKPTTLTVLTQATVFFDVTRGRKNPLWTGLSKRLRRLRELLDINQSELAALASCAHSTVWRVETDRYRTSIDVVEMLAVALGVSPTFLAFGHEGVIPFRQKQPVPDVTPSDPLPSANRATSAAALAHSGIAARLTHAREVRGCTLRGLAQRAGLSAQAVLYIEQAKVVPKVDTVELLAVALDVAPGWLAYGEGVGPAGLPENVEQQQE